MKILKPPLQNINAEDIYETCVQNYTDKAKVQRLLACKPLVEFDSESYSELMPNQIDKWVQSDLPSNVSAKEMKEVYDEKFAKTGSIGRTYYDLIMAQASRRICPICGVRTISTLDHYLPKAKVPTLAITPCNLIPACRDCNMDKRTDMELNPSKAPVHLYFDKIPKGIWLHTRVENNLEITFYASCPEEWDDGLRHRIERHLDIYNLHTLYSSHAATEIEDNKQLWRKLLENAGDKALLESMQEFRESAERNDMNSWKAALYRGLEKNLKKLKEWLLNESIVTI